MILLVVWPAVHVLLDACLDRVSELQGVYLLQRLLINLCCVLSAVSAGPRPIGYCTASTWEATRVSASTARDRKRHCT